MALPSGVQAKLVIGGANDPLEREADRIAEQVNSEREVASAPSTSARPEAIQRKCSACSASEAVREEDQEDVRRKATDAGGTPAAGAGFRWRLQRAVAEGGRPIEPATRSFMEAGIGADFGGVRIHTGPRSAELTREIKARAFTYRRDVFFGAGEYRPTERSGQKLLAHELAHVTQQDAHRATMLRRKPIASGELADAINMRRPAPGKADDRVLHSPEMWQCQISEADVSPTPQMGSFYQLRPRQSLLDVVAGAVQPVTPEQQLALAQVINDHPCNARFHTGSGPEAGLFHGTVISSEPRFADSAEAQGASLDGGTGGRCAIVWIPAQTFKEGANLTNSTGFEVPRIDAAKSTLLDGSCRGYPIAGMRADFGPLLETIWRTAKAQIKLAYAAVPRVDLGGLAPSTKGLDALHKAFGLSKDLQSPGDIVWLREIRAKLSAMNSLMEAGNLRIECDPGDGSKSATCGSGDAVAEPGRIVLCERTMGGAFASAKSCQGQVDRLIHEVAHYTFRTVDHSYGVPGRMMGDSDRRTTLVNADSFRIYVREVQERPTCSGPAPVPSPAEPEKVG